jgi:hypothetical protein
LEKGVVNFCCVPSLWRVWVGSRLSDSFWGVLGGAVDVETVAAKSNTVSRGVDVVHANHHGSGHSSNSEYVSVLAPQASLISCGYDNSHGHPAQTVLDRLLNTGDVFLTNVCALDRAYGRSVFADGDIVLSSIDGASFHISGSTKQYTSKRAAARLLTNATHTPPTGSRGQSWDAPRPTCAGRRNGTYCVGPVIAPVFPLNRTLLSCPGGNRSVCLSGYYCGESTGDPPDDASCHVL